MMSDILDNNGPAPKQLRLSPKSSGGETKGVYKTEEQSNALDLTSSHSVSSTIHGKGEINLSMIKFIRILDEVADTKMIHIEGEYGGDKVVLTLEKTPFHKDTVEKILSSTDKSLKKDFTNDIYGTYRAYPQAELNGIRVTIIHPATDLHISKYSAQSFFMIQETPEDYKNITLPYIESQSFSLDWVYNVLDHSSEAERIIFEDNDEEKGFILAPDSKWADQQDGTSNMHCLAIVTKKGIKSLRDLTSAHLTLLTNIRDKGSQAMNERYGIKGNQLRIYIHYQPSFYHFHVHFEPLSYRSSSIERCHLIDHVIDNLTLIGDYYQKATLTFPVKENSGLHLKYQELKSLA
ncbi:m7GpppX diphosphatase-like [Panonychus citri]|uniref:m7GpppX diphosphatase-like n=1 Tax=Panonychus citri TaxID=50023 RepID=UPI0023073A4B|nr:m7GpppX diphosphatase-like [Panonychus citri]